MAKEYEATDYLKIGFTLARAPGSKVTAEELDRFPEWKDKVKEVTKPESKVENGK